MAKKKKRGLGIVVLLLVLAALIAAYIAYSNYEAKKKEKENADEAKDSIEVIKMEPEDITSISYTNEKADLTLVKNAKEAWTIDTDQQIPLNSTYTNKMASSIAEVKATKVVVENADDLSEFGLTEPTLTITVKKKDDSQTKLLVGSKSPLGDGYYACMDGEKKVYMIETALVSAYDYDESALAETASAPAITVANVTHFKMEDKDTGVLEITYDKDNGYDVSDSGMSPYVLNQGYAFPVAGDSTNITAYFGNFASLRYGKCVDYNGTDLAKYGLDQPKTTIQIDYYEEEKTQDTASGDQSSDSTSKKEKTVEKDCSYTLMIGSYDEAENAYYVKDAAADSVYTMTKDAVDKMLTYKVFDLAGKYAQLIGVKSVDEVQCTYEGETHKLSVTHTTSKDDKGNEQKNESFSLDGKEYNEDDARTLYQAMIGPMYDAEIPDGYTDTDKPVIVSFVFKRTAESGSNDQTIEYKEYDDSFYTVTVNGVEGFLVDKRDVQKAVDALKNALK